MGTFSSLDPWVSVIPLCLITDKCPSATASDFGQREDVFWETEEMFSAIGQALLTQTRYTLPQGHHLTMSTPNSIIPDRLVVPGEHHLTGPEAVHVFTHHSDGSPIPELPSQHLSSQPGIKPLASLCHQSLQEIPYSKLHCLPHLDSASGALRELMCGTCDCACMDAFLCVCVCPCVCMFVYANVCIHACTCACASLCVVCQDTIH